MLVTDAILKANERLVWSAIHDLEYIPEKVAQSDLFQIGMIELWTALRSYEEDCQWALSTHCYRRIYCRLVDHLRMVNAKKRQEPDIEMDSIVEFEDELIGTFLPDEIRRLLPTQDAEIFIDRYANQMSYIELIEKHGKSERTIRNKLNKAKQTLQEKLDWEG